MKDIMDPVTIIKLYKQRYKDVVRMKAVLEMAQQLMSGEIDPDAQQRVYAGGGRKLVVNKDAAGGSPDKGKGSPDKAKKKKDDEE